MAKCHRAISLKRSPPETFFDRPSWTANQQRNMSIYSRVVVYSPQYGWYIGNTSQQDLKPSLIQGTKALGFAFGWAAIWSICVYSTAQCLVPGKHLHGKFMEVSLSQLIVSPALTESLLGWFQSGGRKSRSFANKTHGSWVSLTSSHVCELLLMWLESCKCMEKTCPLWWWLHGYMTTKSPSNTPWINNLDHRTGRPQCQAESDSAKWPASCHAWNDLRDSGTPE